MPLSDVPPDLTDAFEFHRAPGRRALVRRDLARAIEAAGLLTRPPADAASPAGGRGGAGIATLGGDGELVVRPGRRGGWFGRIVRRRYFLGDRFLEELVLTERLRRRGAPVPEAVAAVRRRRVPGYETWLVTRRIPGAGPAAHELARADGRLAEPLAAMGRAVRALHDAGGDHADLNAWNVLLVRPGGGEDLRAHVVDLDRGRLFGGPLPSERAERNLARLRRSLGKLGLDAALAAWPAFERAYASAR